MTDMEKIAFETGKSGVGILLAKEGTEYHIISSEGFYAAIPVCACEENGVKCKPNWQHWNPKRIQAMYESVCRSYDVVKKKKEK